jgi:chromosome segregation ATPase
MTKLKNEAEFRETIKYAQEHITRLENLRDELKEENEGLKSDIWEAERANSAKDQEIKALNERLNQKHWTFEGFKEAIKLLQKKGFKIW